MAGEKSLGRNADFCENSGVAVSNKSHFLASNFVQFFPRLCGKNTNLYLMLLLIGRTVLLQSARNTNLSTRLPGGTPWLLLFLRP